MEFNLLDFMLTNKDLITKDRPLRLRLDYCTRMSDDLLLPQRVYGTQSMCGGIEYRILCVSIRYDIQLKDLIGVAAGLDFVTDQGELHSVCGIITEVSAGDSDGGLASYQIVLRDALALLERRTNTRVFRYKNEVQIVQLIIEEWRKANAMLGIAFEFAVDSAFGLHTYPPREFTMQHNETDAAFIRRLLKRRGIAWHFQARHGGDYPHHTLVLSNNVHGLRASSAGTVRYHRDGPCEQRDTITSWNAVRTLQPSSVELFSWDYKRPNDAYSSSAGVNSSAKQGLYAEGFAATLDDYLVMPPHSGDDPQDLRRLGQLQMAHHDYEAKCFHGEGTVRDFACGEYFSLEWHPEIDTHLPQDREFTITALQVAAMNNLPKVIGERMERLFARNRWLQHGQDGWLQRELSEQAADGGVRMRIHFTAVRRDTPVVPAYNPRTDLPQPQMQSAIVVGPEGEEVHCDELGRVKIRFPATRWQDHQHMEGAGARNDQSDSAWVRVASNWAGNGPGSQQQCGALTLPRVGTEVLVSFLGGDPDKPIIVGQLYNLDSPPAALQDGDRLPTSRYLSGFKSREFGGIRSNQLSFDDTHDQISTRMSSDHADSRLNLGFLATDRYQGTGTFRGEGAELSTNAAIALRAKKGVLITASPTSNQDAQLKREELLGITELAGALAQQLDELQGGAASGDQSRGLEKNIERIANWGKPQTSTTENSSREAVVAISSLDGTVISSEETVSVTAGKNATITSSGNTILSSGRDLLMRTLNGISLFSYKIGIKMIAASGNIKISAENGDVEIISLKKIKFIANEGIELHSPSINFMADGVQINYKQGNIETKLRKTYSVNAGNIEFKRGDDATPMEVSMSSRVTTYDQCIEVVDHLTNQPLPNKKYKIKTEDGKVFEGYTDEKGLTQRFDTNIIFCKYTIEVLD